MLFATLTEVLDPEPHPAALNMAIDEILLRTAREPLLRLYRWARPAVSFGYFGKWAEVAAAWPNRERVRRWTGGGVVLHGDDVTYTLIVPRDHALAALRPAESYQAIHAAVATALGAASLAPQTAVKVSEACFENAAQFDILAAGRKIAGAAQRRTNSGLLHQGSIQPVTDPEALRRSLPVALAAQRTTIPLSAASLAEAETLALEKYGSPRWQQRW